MEEAKISTKEEIKEINILKRDGRTNFMTNFAQIYFQVKKNEKQFFSLSKIKNIFSGWSKIHVKVLSN
jgi:hypothetical protein